MNWKQLLDGFDFNNEAVFDQEVNDMPLGNLYSFVVER
jgi:hypothetical protein